MSAWAPAQATIAIMELDQLLRHLVAADDELQSVVLKEFSGHIWTCSAHACALSKRARQLANLSSTSAAT